MKLTKKQLLKKLEEYREALIWCSGSQDFQEGGKARKGWLKIQHLCQSIIEQELLGEK